MQKTIERKYILIFILSAILISWFLFFSIDNYVTIYTILNGLFFMGFFAGYFVIIRLKTPALNTGWEMVTAGLLIGLLDTLSYTPGIISLVFAGALPITGIILITHGIFRVVKKYSENEKNIHIQKSYFQQLFDNSPNGIAMLDTTNNVIDVNKGFSKIFGYTAEEVKGKNINDLIVPTEERKRSNELSRRSLSEKSVEAEGIRKRKDGKKIFVSIVGFPIIKEDNPIGIYAIYRDITESKKREAKIKYLSFHDELTGLYNRRYLENELKRLNNSRRLPITVVMSDLDNLKKTNDSLGHHEGDDLIKKAARVIKSVCRKEDIIARLGGDEFVIILPETDAATAEKFCRRIEAKCHECNEETRLNISISTGYATMVSQDEDLDDIFRKADQKMYKNKMEKR